MEKFCGKCGSKLDEKTGLCSNCNVGDSIPNEGISHNLEREGLTENTFNKKNIKRKKKVDKKANKKVKRAGWSIWKKIQHFFAKILLLIFIICGLFVAAAGTFEYVDLADIPLIQELKKKYGDGIDDNEISDDFIIVSDKFTDIKIVDSNSAIQAAQDGAKKIGIGETAKELTVQSIDEVGELTYYRLQQNYEGYPVYGKSFVVVSHGSKASNLTSNCYPISDVNLNIAITSDEVKESIKRYLIKKVGATEFDCFEVESLAEDNLCIYPLENKSAKLAFHVNAFTNYGNYEFFVDAGTAEVLFVNHDVWYIQKEFTYDGQEEKHTFTAEHTEEHNEMAYYTENGTAITVSVPVTGHDYDWYVPGNADIATWKDNEKPDKSAVDAMYNLSKIYHYYKNTFSRKSFSNQDEDIRAYIHTIGYQDWDGKDYNLTNNAYFWESPNGPIISITLKYDENGKQVIDYGSELDVLGHEFTHGVVSFTSALSNTENNKMPSAINEAVSDIMGYCIEATVLSKEIDWVCSCRTSIKDDNEDADYVYHFDDYPGHEEEHCASTIVSYAAYLMNTSETGTISDQEIARLWYHSILTLPSNCTFEVLREHVEMAAQNLNFSDDQRQTISNAFEAVGITLDDTKSAHYNTNISVNVFDTNSKLYDDYTIEVSGTYNTGWFGWSWFGLFKEDYNQIVQVNDTNSQTIYLKTNGEYDIAVRDGKDETKSSLTRIKVKEKYTETQLVFSTDFGVYLKNEENEEKEKLPIPGGAVEFNGHYYYLYSGGIAASYDEALRFCNRKGGYLATITSKEENDFLYTYITNKKCDSAYFGLSDTSNEGHWEWCTGEPLSYTNWSYGEPNSQNEDEDYAMFYYQYTNGAWNDGDFEYNTLNGGNAFICEWGEYSTLISETAEGGKISEERDLVLALDVSGSMEGEPLEETQKAASNFVDTVLNEDASIGLVTYDDYSTVVSGFSNDKGSLQSSIRDLYSGGCTNIEAGLRSSQELLESTNAKKRIIVLMSDGEPNEGLQGDELISYANELKASGTIIYTLGFFESLYDHSYAQNLMERIASDGCHYEVANADELVFFFEDMADQINGQKYIYVRIACPVDVSVTCDGETLDSSDRNLNTRTSFGTLTFEDSQEESDEEVDDRVKVLRLKEGTDYDLELNGTGHGFMNYTIGFTDENGDYSDLRKFRNIKITRNTKIDTVASKSDESILNIDEDGDGKYDLKLRAEENGYGKEVSTVNWLLYMILGTSVFVLLNILTIVLYVRYRRKVRR